MVTNTGTSFPLDQLLECGECGSSMRLQEGPEPTYHCTVRPDGAGCFSAPALKARDLNQLLIQEVMQVVITDSTLPAFTAEVGGALAHDGQMPVGQDEILRIATGPDWLMAEGQAREAATIFGSFIESIQVHQGTALVKYRMPLPKGTLLAGASRQDVNLPESVLA